MYSENPNVNSIDRLYKAYYAKTHLKKVITLNIIKDGEKPLIILLMMRVFIVLKKNTNFVKSYVTV